MRRRKLKTRKKPATLIADIIQSGDRIIIYTDGLTYRQFIRDPKTADAVVRNFQIIGEAVAKLPSTFKKQHPEIPWSSLRALRNRVVHQYSKVNKLVWEEKETGLQNLLAVLRSVPKS